MMATFAILTPALITEQDLIRFVADEGGEWVTELNVAFGMFREGKNYIHIDLESTFEDVLPEDLQMAEQTCGRKIQTSVGIDYNRKGRRLAMRIVEKVISRWGGHFIDYG